MTPIISPWFIYLLSVANSIKGVAGGFAILTGMGLMASIGGWIACKAEAKEFWQKFWKKLIKIIAPIFAVLLFLSIFFPTRDALIGIYVVKHITVDKIDEGVKAGKLIKDELKKDIIDLINAINNKKSEE